MINKIVGAYEQVDYQDLKGIEARRGDYLTHLKNKILEGRDFKFFKGKDTYLVSSVGCKLISAEEEDNKKEKYKRYSVVVELTEKARKEAKLISNG